MYYPAMHPIRLLPILLMLAACGGTEQQAAAPAPDTDPSWTGLTRPMDVIHARNEVMEHMELLMEAIDTIQVEPVRNVDQLHLQAEAIAAMLAAAPHLFPPTTNLYKPEGPDYPTLALPTIWENFDTFYKLAMAASAAAEEFAETTGDEPLRAASRKLRNSCDACHTLYERKYVPQKPGPEDFGFDFEGAIGQKK
jgi:cytochrome c556